MRFSAAIATLLTVGLSAAQSRRATCAAQNILDACLATEQAQLSGCAANDWDCLCEQSNNVLTCYNNCPGDDGQFGAQQTMTSYCNAAKAYGTSTSSTASSSTTASASAASSASSATASEEASATHTGTATSGHSSSTSTATGAFSTSSHSAAAPVAGTFAQGGLVAALALGLGLIL
ncbi:hypothetical protein DPV78_002198 [Talaromyces pinophilus]|nr:hypothetical protein DPV78_002198 [Talaromyces pinophilus]